MSNFATVAERPRPLSVDTLVEQARATTGLHEFGEETFLEALCILVRSINEEAQLNAFGWERERSELVRLLANRLRLHRLLTDHPEIRDEIVEAPVVVVGLQRSGTTKLFRVMASDPQWLSPLMWEVLHPAPPEPGMPDQRIQWAHEWCAPLKAAGMDAAHRLEPEGNEQESFMMVASFRVPFPGLSTPTHHQWCETADYRPVYENLRDQLKVLQWRRAQVGRSTRGKRWMLKTPSHLHNLPALKAAFPDIKIVMTHRHPKTSVASMLAIVELHRRMLSDNVDRALLGRTWLRDLALAMHRSMAFRDSCGPDAILDVSFRDVVHDAGGTVRRIYDHVGAPFTVTTQNALVAWEEENPEGKHGAHKYALADFGLSEADIEREFADYLTRFQKLL